MGTGISAGGDAGCGEVTELELSDRNDTKRDEIGDGEEG